MSVCLSQAGVLAKRLNGFSLFLEASLAYSALCYKEIWVSAK